MIPLTYLILALTALSGGVGYGLALLATGAVAPGIAQLFVYGGLLVLFWHKIVNPLWGSYTHKNMAKRKTEQDALAAAGAQKVIQGRIDGHSETALVEHKTCTKNISMDED